MPYLRIFFLIFLISSCARKNHSTATSVEEVSEVSSSPSFKRSVPKKVLPIVIENVKYSSTMNEIIATDTLTKALLWKKEIYKITYDEKLERDIQDVFIDSISSKDNLLIIRNEDNDVYSLNLETKEIIKL
ncbi:hypothetical protein [uncultured Flavobacterium sp.]|uniref:hypothetical protein n=1 Tax=uncultured Flavobacterium sp. TaxID=165435 RepID=UPI0030ED0105|tara:strand:+ start:160316 stop:160708 length:393 start_codon:yes stop_codon:yes gene_type:complete